MLGVVVLVGVASAGWLAVHRAASDTDAARSVTDSFLHDLESSDYPGAYRLLTSDAQAVMTEAVFARTLQAQPRHVRGHSIDGVNSSAVHPRTYVAVFVQVTFTDGGMSPFTIGVLPQDGHWRVRSAPFWGLP